ncbi:MAG: hypothetical protein FWC47_14425 [Oscillospiraceae bacterium]|nr:hypothetical protein [Oscillospiraceae bacterium]
MRKFFINRGRKVKKVNGKSCLEDSSANPKYGNSKKAPFAFKDLKGDIIDSIVDLILCIVEILFE